jgi:diguanylate cyclase
MDLLLTHISMWVLGSAVVSLLAGYHMGRTTRFFNQAGAAAKKEQKAALEALVELLQAVEQLTNNVGTRNSEIREVGRHVEDLHVTGELEELQQVLLGQIATVLKSNQQLEDDLVDARCRMEEQAAELDRTRHEAQTDALSGVFNRKAFNDKLRVLLGRWKRDNEPFVLIMADLDHFKWINDTHGHTVGDRVLQEVGTLLRRCLREGDFVGRYGGDEFAVLLPRTDVVIGKQVADRLHHEATRCNFGVGTRSEQAALTISFGLAAAIAGDNSESIVHRADEALYRSKRGGRNQVQCQEPPQEQEQQQQLPEAVGAA